MYFCLLPQLNGQSNSLEEHLKKEEMRLKLGRKQRNKMKLSLEASACFLIWDRLNGKVDFLVNDQHEFETEQMLNSDLLSGCVYINNV
jgi:hypothetical protein